MTTAAPMTATQKILARACQRSHVAPGEVIYPEPEWVIVHDGFVETARGHLDYPRAIKEKILRELAKVTG